MVCWRLVQIVGGEEAVSRQKIKELLTRRINSQPLNLPNAGSVFRNPPGDWAARDRVMRTERFSYWWARWFRQARKLHCKHRRLPSAADIEAVIGSA